MLSTQAGLWGEAGQTEDQFSTQMETIFIPWCWAVLNGNRFEMLPCNVLNISCMKYGNPTSNSLVWHWTYKILWNGSHFGCHAIGGSYFGHHLENFHQITWVSKPTCGHAHSISSMPYLQIYEKAIWKGTMWNSNHKYYNFIRFLGFENLYLDMLIESLPCLFAKMWKNRECWSSWRWWPF